MRKFIRYLRAAWLYSRFFPYVEEAEERGFWDEGDSQRLYQFFQTQTGQKLKIKLRNYATRAACVAVKNPTNSPYNNGVAAGIPMLTVAIESLFPASVPTDAESNLTEAEAGFDQIETTA